MLTKKIEVIDHAATGAKLRQMREQRGISMRAVAQKMKISAPYLSALERGHTPWSDRRVKQFEAAIRPVTGK